VDLVVAAAATFRDNTREAIFVVVVAAATVSLSHCAHDFRVINYGFHYIDKSTSLDVRISDWLALKQGL
jgi:hypothetical protein